MFPGHRVNWFEAGGIIVKTTRKGLMCDKICICGEGSHKRIFTSSRGGWRLIPLAKVATKF